MNHLVFYCNLFFFLSQIQEWEIAEKTLADGSKKRVRHRIIIQRVLNVNPEFYKDSVEEEDILEQKPLQVTTQKTESDVLNNEIEVDEGNPFDEGFDLKVNFGLYQKAIQLFHSLFSTILVDVNQLLLCLKLETV